MPEISCQNCQAVCCKGLLTIELSLEEAAFMLRGGTKLMTIAQPSDHARDNVIYPVGYETSRNQFLVRKGKENEPLAAGVGRYVMLGSCGYLETDENGWEYCGVYEQRPDACQKFEMAGAKCQLLRIVKGVDTGIEAK